MKSSIALAIPAVIGTLAMALVGETDKAVAFALLMTLIIVGLTREADKETAVIGWFIGLGMPLAVMFRVLVS